MLRASDRRYGRLFPARQLVDDDLLHGYALAGRLGSSNGFALKLGVNIGRQSQKYGYAARLFRRLAGRLS